MKKDDIVYINRSMASELYKKHRVYAIDGFDNKHLIPSTPSFEQAIKNIRKMPGIDHLSNFRYGMTLYDFLHYVVRYWSNNSWGYFVPTEHEDFIHRRNRSIPFMYTTLNVDHYHTNKGWAVCKEWIADVLNDESIFGYIPDKRFAPKDTSYEDNKTLIAGNQYCGKEVFFKQGDKYVFGKVVGFNKYGLDDFMFCIFYTKEDSSISLVFVKDIYEETKTYNKIKI